MKREEAVKLVKEVTGMSLDWDDAHYEALQMAIKALEQESCEDCISREAVLAMSDYIGETPTYDDPLGEVEEVVRVKDIMALPPVAPARKKGKPIYDIDSQDWEFNRPIKCPFCNERFDYSNHYCHNCGAEMEMEEE
jgi:hypothetical protein